MIPVRDRCWDPRAPRSTHVALSRGEAGCVLHLHSGDVSVDPSQCAELQREPGLVSTFTRACAPVGIVVALFAVYALGTLSVGRALEAGAAPRFAGIDAAAREGVAPLYRGSGGRHLAAGWYLGGDALRIASVMRPADEGRRGESAGGDRRRLDPPRSRHRPVARSRGSQRVIGRPLGSGVTGRAAGRRAGGDPDRGARLALFVLRRARRLPWIAFAYRRAASRRRSSGPVLGYIRDPRAPGAITAAAALSAVVAAVQFVVIRGLRLRAGRRAPTGEKWVYVGTAMAFIVERHPVGSPGGWGTADAAYVFFFGLGGIVSSVALAVCLLFRLFWYLSGVAGAFLRLTRHEAAAVTLSTAGEAVTPPVDPP